MAYTILNTDGTTLLNLADGKVNQTITSLSLVGRNSSNYGEHINNNFIKLLANSASSAGAPPRSPIKGQLWYDTTSKRLKIYDDGFKNLNGVTIADTLPAVLQTGDLWFDSTTYQLKILNSGNTYIIGPAYPATLTSPSQGWVILDTPIKEAETNISKDLLMLKSYGSNIAIAYSGDKFTASVTDTAEYLSGNSEIVNGLTVPGDLRVYGQITNNYLSTTIDIDKLVGSGSRDVSNILQIRIQNTAIATILDTVFPSNSASSGSYKYAGLPLGTVARVVCSCTDGAPANGHQVRLYRTVSDGDSTRWQSWNIFTVENIID